MFNIMPMPIIIPQSGGGATNWAIDTWPEYYFVGCVVFMVGGMIASLAAMLWAMVFDL